MSERVLEILIEDLQRQQNKIEKLKKVIKFTPEITPEKYAVSQLSCCYLLQELSQRLLIFSIVSIAALA
jgi:hypothetical protein